MPLRRRLLGGARGQTIALRSALRRPRSPKLRGRPVAGSSIAVPVSQAERFASVPAARGVMCVKPVPVSEVAWQPLQVLTEK
jgi:hypothetical protein